MAVPEDRLAHPSLADAAQVRTPVPSAEEHDF